MSIELTDFFSQFFNHAWTQRPIDIQSIDSSISIQAALSYFRDQTRMEREEMCKRLGVNNSRLAYLDTHGRLDELQFRRMISMCREYSLDNLADFFDRQLRAFIRPSASAANKARRYKD